MDHVQFGLSLLPLSVSIQSFPIISIVIPLICAAERMQRERERLTNNVSFSVDTALVAATCTKANDSPQKLGAYITLPQFTPKHTKNNSDSWVIWENWTNAKQTLAVYR